MAFFTQRGYPLTSLEQGLRRVTTIGRPDGLTGSERGDTTVDRVPLVMTYHPFNTHIKRYLLQNFRILSTDQQTRDIFPQPPIVEHKCDLSLRDILAHSTDISSTEQPGSHTCQRTRCQTGEFINPLTHSLRSRIGEHLGSVPNHTAGFPVAGHFNSAGHSITDVQVRGMRLCRGFNILCKQLEMRLIFQLGTVQPDGLNINFKYV